MPEYDVVIVGAGAAGVGAVRRLHATGRSILIVEAGDRVGGRACTMSVAGIPLDLGCGWLHSAQRNPWTTIGESAGFTIDRSPTRWGSQFRDLGFSTTEQAAAGEAFARFTNTLRTDPPASDRAADALSDDDAWNPYIEALSGYINGAGLAALSVADYLAYDDAASDMNWRVREGYGALIAASLPPSAPLQLATPVTAIDLDGRSVRLITPRGDITAQAVILTMSTAVLGTGRMTLPAALDDHRQAASQLPLGLADKLFLSFDDGDIPADSHLIGDPRNAATGSYYLRPFGRDVVECFFGGTGATALERAGLDGAAHFAIDELAGLFGNAVRRRLKLLAGSAWGRADWIGGSYSHALPGAHAQRMVLARPVDGRVFFAGEACSSTDFSTAHGAFATGVAAAEAALAALS